MDKTLEEKTCVWFILGKPYEPCPACNRYDTTCPEYIPLQESEVERVSRIQKNLYKKELKKRQ